MIDLKYIIDPLMGTIIGFGTNFIAVKMLFRPYKAIKIGKFQLPFTPGVIPKRRTDISKALGEIISKALFTSDDIKDVFLTDDIKLKVSNSIISNLKKEDVSLKDIFLNNMTQEKYDGIKQDLINAICQKISDGVIDIQIAKIIKEEGTKVVKEKLKESFFGSFVSEDKIKSMADPIGEEIEKYLKANIKILVSPYIKKEISELEDKSLKELFEKTNLSDDRLRIIIESIYIKIVNEKMQAIFDSINISKVIQDKIDNMDVKEIEKLFMIVMKKELNAIINLGAFLGLLLGIINAVLL